MSSRTPRDAAAYPSSVFTMPSMPIGWCESASCARPMPAPMKMPADLAPPGHGEIDRHK